MYSEWASSDSYPIINHEIHGPRMGGFFESTSSPLRGVEMKDVGGGVLEGFRRQGFRRQD
jgi:hypothetical protein